MSRAALLLRMTKDEAEKVRSEAVKCGEKMNAYVLRVALRAAVEDHLSSANGSVPGELSDRTVPSSVPKTALLIRCSVKEAARIREAASRRKMTIVGFIRHALRMNWKAEHDKRGVTADRSAVALRAC